MKLIAFVLALLPILWLMLALGVLKKPAFKACPIALVVAVLLALTYWKMPVKDCVTGGLEGVAMAIWPVSLVIIAAVFTYNLCIATGSMEKIKKVLTGVSKDRRILLLLIGWGFGGFLEGMAGFGTAVAIPAGILCGLGFSPVLATVACLVANATPTAFGSVGIPTVTLAQLTGISQGSLAWDTAVQLLPLILITPFVMVIIEGKSVKALKGIWPIALASGIAFAAPELLAARFLGAELPVIIGSVCSMAVTILMAKRKNQKQDIQYRIEDKNQKDVNGRAETTISTTEAVKACIPFILIFVFLLLTSSMVPSVHDALGKVKTAVQIYSGKGGTPYTFTWIATPGVLILLAAVIGGKIQGADFSNDGKGAEGYLQTDVEDGSYDHVDHGYGKDHEPQWNDRRDCRNDGCMDRKLLSGSSTIRRSNWNICNRKWNFCERPVWRIAGGDGGKSWTGSILACRSQYSWGDDRKDDFATEYRDWNGGNGKCRK